MKMIKYLKIQTNMACNAKCLFCPLETLKRKKGRMDSKFVFKIIDEAMELGYEIICYFLGEPLLESRLFQFFDYIQQKGGKQELFTNASLITPEVAGKLGKYQYSRFVISFHGGNKESYERVTKLNFEKTVFNIKHLLALNKIPNYLISMKACKENKESVEDFKKLWKGYNISVSNALDFVGKFGTGKGGIKKCPVLNMPCVFWDGKMPLCCLDVEGEIILGDLKKQSLKEILSGPIYQKYLNLNEKRKLNEIFPCKRCNRER